MSKTQNYDVWLSSFLYKSAPPAIHRNRKQTITFLAPAFLKDEVDHFYANRSAGIRAMIKRFDKLLSTLPPEQEMYHMSLAIDEESKKIIKKWKHLFATRSDFMRSMMWFFYFGRHLV